MSDDNMLHLNRGDVVEISDIIDPVMTSVYNLKPGMRGIVMPHNEYFQIGEKVEEDNPDPDKDGVYFFISPTGKKIGPIGRMPEDHQIIVWQNHEVTNLDVVLKNKLKWTVVDNKTPKV